MAIPKLRGYLTIVGGVIFHLTLGTLYTFGNMAPYMVSYIRKNSSPQNLRYNDATLIYAAVIAGQGITLNMGGFLEQYLGVRWAVICGAVLISGSVAVSAITIQSSFTLLLVTYGFTFGFGVGLGYIPPLVCVNKWFPDKKGLVNGIIVAGFGGGAFIFNIVQTYYINPHNLSPDIILMVNNHTEQYYSQDSVLDKVPSAFLVLAISYAVLQVIGIALMSEPPQVQQVRKLTVKSNLISDDEDDDEDETEFSQQAQSHFPKVEEDPSSLDPKSSGWNLRPLQIIQRRNFWILWLLFMVNAQTIVIVPTLYKAFGQTFISNDKLLAVIGSLCAIFNAGGRICWGQLVDKTSFKLSMSILTILNAIIMFTLGTTASGGTVTFTIWMCAIFFTFSGNFVLFPTATARAFGADHFGPNYGILFTSMAVASIAASLLTTGLQDQLGWSHLFQVCGGFSCVGLILTCLFNVRRMDGGYL